MAWDLKDYEPVEDRLREFWSEHPTGRIETDLLHHVDGNYIVKASVWCFDGEARGPDATGLAQDSVDKLPQNMKASALEVCETSAIGRALANLGYAAKGKRPSREEMQKSADLEPTTPSTRGMGEADGPTVPAGEQRDAGGPLSGESPALGEGAGGSPDTSEQKKDFRSYLADQYGTDQAILMAKQLFQTGKRKVPNLMGLNLEELQAIDAEFKARKVEVPA